MSRVLRVYGGNFAKLQKFDDFAFATSHARRNAAKHASHALPSTSQRASPALPSSERFRSVAAVFFDDQTIAIGFEKKNSKMKAIVSLSQCLETQTFLYRECIQSLFMLLESP